MNKENQEWTATSLLYRGLNDFKSTGTNLKTGCPWWVVAKWDYSLLWIIKVMWKLVVTNDIKSVYNCDSVWASNVGHILFGCPIIETIRKKQGQNVVREMPIGMTESVNCQWKSNKYLYMFNGVAINEWINIYKAW